MIFFSFFLPISKVWKKGGEGERDNKLFTLLMIDFNHVPFVWLFIFYRYARNHKFKNYLMKKKAKKERLDWFQLSFPIQIRNYSKYEKKLNGFKTYAIKTPSLQFGFLFVNQLQKREIEKFVKSGCKMPTPN